MSKADDAPRRRVEEDLLADLARSVPGAREANTDEAADDQLSVLALNPAVTV
ncbi:MAG TPA: hypothetical protein VFH56_12170 [Acidimicrobiales bacterium]|nr:hypothetical protein [Acidimicrobiales bacterium]